MPSNLVSTNYFALTFCFSFFFLGYTETLDDNIEVIVPNDDYGLYAIDILDPSLVCSIILPVDFQDSIQLNWYAPYLTCLMRSFE